MSSEDEEWNPPSQDSPSSHSDSDSDGSQIQEGLLQSDEEGDDPNPLDSTAIIATRTRARVPLTNVLLSDLEGMFSHSSSQITRLPLFYIFEYAFMKLPHHTRREAALPFTASLRYSAFFYWPFPRLSHRSYQYQLFPLVFP